MATIKKSAQLSGELQKGEGLMAWTRLAAHKTLHHNMVDAVESLNGIPSMIGNHIFIDVVDLYVISTKAAFKIQTCSEELLSIPNPPQHVLDFNQTSLCKMQWFPISLHIH